MNITKNALKNHDEIFNGVKYALAGEKILMLKRKNGYVYEAVHNEDCGFNG